MQVVLDKNWKSHLCGFKLETEMNRGTTAKEETLKRPEATIDTVMLHNIMHYITKRYRIFVNA